MSSAALAGKSVSLDQLIALSDEIAALSRAGVPLDRGLLELAREMPGRLGHLAGEIGRRIEAGESLAKIMAEMNGTFPPAYRAVIDAGLRAGRLPAALEETARTARRVSGLRKSIGVGLVYPAIVLMVAYGLIVFAVTKIVPVTFKMLAEVSEGGEHWEQTAAWLAGTANWWGPIFPAAVLFWLGYVWWRSGRIAEGIDIPQLMNWGVLGSFQSLQHAGRMASLTDLLALLIRQQVPLDEAVSLASAAVGSKRVQRGGEQLAAQIRRGEIGGPTPPGFSPLLAWTLASGQQGRLPAILQRMSQTYRDEFTRRSQWLSIYVPLVTTTFVAGSVVVLYAAITLAPWIIIMHRLANPLLQ